LVLLPRIHHNTTVESMSVPPPPRVLPPHGTHPVYVVARGRNPGVYGSWEDAEKQVRGFPRARFKKFQSWNGSGGDALGFWNDFASSSSSQTSQTSQASQVSQAKPSSSSLSGSSSGGSSGPSPARRKRPASGDLASGRPTKEIRLSHEETSSSTTAVEVSLFDSFLATRSTTVSSQTLSQFAEVAPQGQQQQQQQPQQAQQQQHQDRNSTRKPQESSNKDKFEVYTDGSCLSNPDGAGGWAAVFVVSRTSRQSRPQSRDEVVTVSGGYPRTTNNRMELRAMTSALQMLPKEREATVFTDSQYVRQGVEEWVENWRKRGWKTVKGKDVLNRDLWEELSAARAARPRVALRWVRAHDGNRYNEVADKSARAAAREIQQSTALIADW
jgi:ribonuclease HI